MKVIEHLTEETIARYGLRETAPTETLTVQTHAAACETCRARLTRVVDADESFAFLQNEFENFDEFEHLPYEQLAFYADGKLDEVDREIADSHFAVCDECSADLADLRRYQTIANEETAIVPAALPTREIIESPQASWWQKLFASDFFSGSLVPAGALAVLIIGVLVIGVWLIARNNQNEMARVENTNQANQNVIAPAPTAVLTPNAAPIIEPNANTVDNSNQTAPQNSATTNENKIVAPVEQNPMLALNDSGGQITFGTDGSLNGLESQSSSVRDAVQRAVKGQKVHIPNSIDAVTSGNLGVLMSGSAGATNNGVPFALVTPVGRVIRDTQPTLRWKTLEGATKYTVAVVDQKFRVVAESPALAKPEWAINKPLPRGAAYSWQVTAVKENGEEAVSPASPAPQAKFYVIGQTAFDEVRRVESSGTKSHLARGVVYANAGLVDEARREFQALVKQNPNSALARKLLAGVQ